MAPFPILTLHAAEAAVHHASDDDGAQDYYQTDHGLHVHDIFIAFALVLHTQIARAFGGEVTVVILCFEA